MFSIRAIVCLILISAIPAVCQSARVPTVDEIVERSIAARGGRAALASITSLSWFRKDPQPATSPNMVKMRPQYLLVGCVELDCGWAEGYDGSAWEMQPKAQRVIRARYEAAKALRRTAEFDDSLIDFRNKGHLARLAGLETFLQRPVYRIEMVLSDGLLVTWYIDRETYLPVANRTRVPIHARGEHVEGITRFSDFRPAVNSTFLYPHKLTGVDLKTMQDSDAGGGWKAIVANLTYDARRFSPPAVNPPKLTQTILRLWSTSAIRDPKEWFSPYQRLRETDHSLGSTEDDLIWLAYEMLKENEREKAMLALNTSLEENGESWNLRDSLGDACAQFLDSDAAAENYRRAIALKPDAHETQRKLDTLLKPSR